MNGGSVDGAIVHGCQRHLCWPSHHQWHLCRIPLSMLPTSMVPPEFACPLTAPLSAALPSTVLFNYGTVNSGGSIKIHTTIKLSNLLGWDGVGELQWQNGGWVEQ
jgi:hypothetical protein